MPTRPSAAPFRSAAPGWSIFVSQSPGRLAAGGIALVAALAAIATCARFGTHGSRAGPASVDERAIHRHRGVVVEAKDGAVGWGTDAAACVIGEARCRACEAALGSVEWRRRPWWAAFLSTDPKTTWAWARFQRDDDADGRAPPHACGFRTMTPREARETLRGRSVLFVGNSVSRRLMYAVADAMGGANARVNALATDRKAAAKYGVQRVWDSKRHYHSFFETPVRADTGELGPQVTCLAEEGGGVGVGRNDDESVGDGDADGEGEGDSGGGAEVGGRGGVDDVDSDEGGGVEEEEEEEAAAAATDRGGRRQLTNHGRSDEETPWFPNIDELFGFDPTAEEGAGAVSRARSASRRIRCPGGASSWRRMRARHPDAATRLAFAYTNTPPTAVAAALLRAWAEVPLGSSYDEHVGANYDVVVVQVARGANVKELRAAATAFARRRHEEGRPVRVVFIGVPHAKDMGHSPRAEAGVARWVDTVAWPVLRGHEAGGDDESVEIEAGDEGGSRGSAPDSTGLERSSGFSFSPDVVDITRATFRGVVLGHIEHERTSGHHFTDEGRRLTAQLLLNRLAMCPCANTE